MSSLARIQQPVKAEMDYFEGYFRESMKSKVPLLDIVMNYLFRRKGKQMRPLLVFLSARLNGEINQASYTGAALIELLHTASLIHDDVVDESYLRRGFFSINALWRNKIAVLSGDFLLSKGLLLSIENDQVQLLKIVSEAVKEMSEGELLQMEKARKLDITEEVYFEIIRKKTATLIASCSAVGAKSVDAGDEKVQLMKDFGMATGIAFQIKDDIFDYESSEKIGKPTANDIKEKKMTLPLIFALNNSSSKEKRHIIHLVKNRNSNPEKLHEIIQFVVDKGGIKYATERMNEYKNKAIQLLTAYPDSPAKASLIELVEFTTTRNK
jgi:octaprenyl-diphosphate synthase